MFSWLTTLVNQKKQIDALRQDVDGIQRQWATAKLDYLELYERCQRLLAKIARRQQREALADGEAPQAGEEASAGAPLSPRQRLIQSQVENLRRIRGGSA